MTQKSIQLPWGQDQVTLALPETWNITGVFEPAALPGVADAAQEAARSLQNPIDCARLAELARPGMKIALVMDDDSRPTPLRLIFPAVVEELKRAGVSLDQLTVVPALGVHRAMTEEEVARRLGEQWMGQLHWESHDCDDPARLHNLGVTSRGTPVLVNKTVAQADLVISIGCIEPHIIASFGGGYKNLFPGVAGRATIAHNHALNCQPDTFNMVGQPIEKNPMRQDLEEAGKMVKGRVFIINAVLNSSLEVVRIVAGDPISAHRAGAQVSAEIYGAHIPAQADVVITASHPMDQDLRQGVKALANTIRAVKPGGVMLTLVRADEGVGVFGLANRKLPVGRTALKLLAPLLLPNISKLKIKSMGEEDRFFLYFAIQAMRQANLLLFAPTIPLEIHERLPFVTFVESLEAGMAVARQKFPGRTSVAVFPYGGSTYPILPV